MKSAKVSIEWQAVSAKATASRRERRALLDQIRRGQLGIESVLIRADTDPIVAKTDARRLVEAFLWHADPTTITGVLTRAGIEPGRRVRGLATWQRTVLIEAIT